MKFACSLSLISIFSPSLLQSKNWRCFCYANASQYGGFWNTLNKDLQGEYSITSVKKQEMIRCHPISVCYSTHMIQSHPKTLDHTDKSYYYSFNSAALLRVSGSGCNPVSNKCHLLIYIFSITQYPHIKIILRLTLLL